MEFFESLKHTIRTMEDTDFYKYGALFFFIFILAFGLIFFFHTRRVNHYVREIQNVEKQRIQTRKILSEYKTVNEHKQKVEEILAQDKNFRIGEVYQFIVQRSGLANRMDEQSAPAKGETVSGNTELVINSHFTGISMKQLTDLLTAIASVPQLYTKEITIKKNAQGQAVDLNLTLATLEPATVE